MIPKYIQKTLDSFYNNLKPLSGVSIITSDDLINNARVLYIKNYYVSENEYYIPVINYDYNDFTQKNSINLEYYIEDNNIAKTPKEILNLLTQQIPTIHKIKFKDSIYYIGYGIILDCNFNILFLCTIKNYKSCPQLAFFISPNVFLIKSPFNTVINNIFLSINEKIQLGIYSRFVNYNNVLSSIINIQNIQNLITIPKVKESYLNNIDDLINSRISFKMDNLMDNFKIRLYNPTCL